MLFDLALSVEPDEIVALIGASGFDKSTVLRHLAGLACCDRGTGDSVRVFDHEVQVQGHLNSQVRSVGVDIGYLFR
nr:ATP-binding cassette domain-containing protein [uncultured Pseudomonas sp.]